jgi:phospholipase D1/2
VETRILTPGRNVWRQARAEDARVIVDAADYYRAFYDAALRARRYILISGWQFDRGVKLLRGVDAVGRGEQIRLVRFLDKLCDRTPSLRIYLLAWDFHMVFALEREWMQRLWFHYATNERLVFRFDQADASGGSHHQKFVVIDDQQAFVGGIDLCEARWDDRAHRSDNPLRVSRGRPVKPYHDLQAHLAGPEMAGALRELFVGRWSRSAGDPPVLEDQAPGPAEELPPPTRGVALGPGPVGISRTDCLPDQQRIQEIEHLFCDAIAAAEALIFIETQYFSSTRICQAVIDRMRAPGRPRLEIVVVVNERAEAFKEEIAVGLRQARNLERLRAVAAETGHALGLYFSLSDGAGDSQRATYIHSKLLAVDDRFLSVGSANLTNRSMGVDTELHVSWEAPEGEPRRLPARGIRRLRVSLLAEHAGLAGAAAIRPLVPIAGLVGRLDALAGRPGGRLRAHGPPSEGQQTAMKVVDPESLPFDPASPDGDDCPEPVDARRR